MLQRSKSQNALGYIKLHLQNLCMRSVSNFCLICTLYYCSVECIVATVAATQTGSAQSSPLRCTVDCSPDRKRTLSIVTGDVPVVPDAWVYVVHIPRTFIPVYQAQQLYSRYEIYKKNVFYVYISYT